MRCSRSGSVILFFFSFFSLPPLLSTRFAVIYILIYFHFHFICMEPIEPIETALCAHFYNQSAHLRLCWNSLVAFVCRFSGSANKVIIYVYLSWMHFLHSNIAIQNRYNERVKRQWMQTSDRDKITNKSHCKTNDRRNNKNPTMVTQKGDKNKEHWIQPHSKIYHISKPMWIDNIFNIFFGFFSLLLISWFVFFFFSFLFVCHSLLLLWFGRIDPKQTKHTIELYSGLKFTIAMKINKFCVKIR